MHYNWHMRCLSLHFYLKSYRYSVLHILHPPVFGFFFFFFTVLMLKLCFFSKHLSFPVVYQEEHIIGPCLS